MAEARRQPWRRPGSTSMTTPTLGAREPATSSNSGRPSEREALGSWRWPKTAGAPVERKGEAARTIAGGVGGERWTRCGCATGRRTGRGGGRDEILKHVDIVRRLDLDLVGEAGQRGPLGPEERNVAQGARLGVCQLGGLLGGRCRNRLRCPKAKELLQSCGGGVEHFTRWCASGAGWLPRGLGLTPVRNLRRSRARSALFSGRAQQVAGRERAACCASGGARCTADLTAAFPGTTSARSNAFMLVAAFFAKADGSSTNRKMIPGGSVRAGHVP